MFLEIDDITRVLNRELVGGEAAQVQSLIELATGAIQGWTRQTIELVTSTAQLAGTWSPDLVLPERPVVAVTSVAVNGTALDAAGWTWNNRQLLRRGGPLAFDQSAGDVEGPDCCDGLHWLGPATTVEVTYDHGFAAIPGDVKSVCAAMVIRAFVNPDGAESESIGAYSVSHGAAHAAAALTDDDKSRLRRYRRSWL